MTEDQERLIDIVRAGITLSQATLAELQAAHRYVSNLDERPLEYHDADLDEFQADLDFALCKRGSLEVIDLIGRLRHAQGWTNAPTQGEQQQ